MWSDAKTGPYTVTVILNLKTPSQVIVLVV